ncbi:hypothetical protein FisN_18Lh024 [Fistulifera solaris]|uniref:Palmitoyltransferase n=1 Tax=Fistulifera solaris TaxID=1519565 RepID=A0A1Z5K1S9_FISSO|nr:hypothetical protein FisN_18Lh024 [Fistulifera solaris]|eukprot:GAX20086.1 hypothetical protein FisN_18Lh024 [Fistulifera solaris]
MPRHEISVCGKRYGTSFTAQRWCSWNVGGLLGLTVSVSIHIYSLLVTFLYLISQSAVAMTCFWVLYCPTTILALVSLYQATMTDPGAVPLGARPLTTVRSVDSNSTNTTTTTTTTKRTIRRCPKCHDNFKPSRAHHDSQTGRCIVKLDHFCPWINNAVGIGNHKFFVLFLLYTALCCMQVLLLLGLKFYGPTEAAAWWCPEVDEERSSEAPPCHESTAPSSSSSSSSSSLHDHSHPLILILAGISCLFLIFTSAMGYEQLEAVQTGHNKIARMQMKVGQHGTEWHRHEVPFNEVLGNKARWSPFHAMEFPAGLRHVVLGYEWDPGMQTVYVEEDEQQRISSSSFLGDEEDVEMQTLNSPTSRSPSPPPPPHSERSHSRNRRKAPSSRSGSLEIV